MSVSSSGFPVSGFAAQLFDQADGFDDHAAIHRLAHIVDGEQGDANALIYKEQQFLIPWFCPSKLDGIWTKFGQEKCPKKA